MAVVVVGGHTRNIGKTTLAAQLLAATRDLHWTAMKITQYGHGVCSANGEPCDCATADHAVAVSEERSADSGSDTARMLAAGAQRVLWVRTQQGDLADAMPRVRKELAASHHALVESNSILRFLRPDVYVAVLHPDVADFKPSALRYLDRADAIFMPQGSQFHAPRWAGVSPAVWQGKRLFALHEDRLDEEALAWFKLRMELACEHLPT